MPIYAIITVLILIVVAYVFARQTTEIPVFINGLIPSLPNAKNKQESGTTVYVFFPDKDKDDPEREIFRGYANEKGIIQSSIAPKFVGKKVTIRIRHAGLKFDDLSLTIPKHGIIHTAKLVPDGVYGGTLRGATITDPNKYLTDSTDEADRIRSDAIRLARSIGLTFGRIPVLFWLFTYIAIIIAFAGDYAANACSFKPHIESFPHAFYLSMVTITTLGYGDVVPIDDWFRITSGVQAVIGVVLIGLFLNSLFYERR